MPSSAVSVEAISKRYSLGAGAGYRRLTEVLFDAARRRQRRVRNELWALRDVSFEVAEGDVLGIVGRNGAGKSTLLKILSRITEPTSGRAVLHGRVGSLLEVGTGFHPELTGRENIYLNGAVLGMRKSEIARRFDDIVEFAEIDRFLDTPVKRYSSGMYVRLAFAVAAHLEPEILVVDEVLAVGDAAFQKKCLGKMDDVAKSGRTVLFVSHNMAAVRSLCSRGVLLDGGQVCFAGTGEGTIDRYLELGRTTVGHELGARTDRTAGHQLRFTKVSFESAGVESLVLVTGEPGAIILEYETSLASPAVRFSIGVSTPSGDRILHLDSQVSASEVGVQAPRGAVRCAFERVALVPGRYVLAVFAEGPAGVLDWVTEAAELEVAEGDFFGSGRLPLPGYGSVLMAHTWSAMGRR